jgi:hypothetical protein
MSPGRGAAAAHCNAATLAHAMHMQTIALTKTPV